MRVKAWDLLCMICILGNAFSELSAGPPQRATTASQYTDWCVMNPHTKEVRTDREQHRRKGQKKVVDPSIIGFRYDRPVKHEVLPAHHVAARSYKSSSSHRPVNKLSKAEYVLANFRFALSPLTNPLEQALYDADVAIPWELVHAVIVPSDPPGEDALGAGCCPICLDSLRVPRITQCGHSFCFPCILRHFYSERNNCDKCPMCQDRISISDLKLVTRCPPLLAPAPGTRLELQHLTIAKGSLRPRRPSTIASGMIAAAATTVTAPVAASSGKGKSFVAHLQLLHDAIPLHDESDGAFSRIVFLSPKHMEDSFRQQLADLAAYEAEHTADMVAQHVAITSPSPPSSTSVSSSSVGGTPMVKGWLPIQNSERRDNSSLPKDGGVDKYKAAIRGAQQEQIKAAMANSVLEEDLVILQFIDEARKAVMLSEERYRQRLAQAQFSDIAAARALSWSAVPSSSPSVGSVDHSVHGTTGAYTDAIDGANGGRGGVYHFYQHSSGAHVYLHPYLAHLLFVDAQATQTVQVANPGAAAVGADASDTALSPPPPPSSSNDVHWPATLQGEVVQVEKVRVTVELKKRVKWLLHEPVHSEILLVDLLHFPYLHTTHAKTEYKKEVAKRRRARQAQSAKEASEDAADQQRQLREEGVIRQRLDEQRRRQREQDEYAQAIWLSAPPLPVSGAAAEATEDIGTNDNADLDMPALPSTNNCAERQRVGVESLAETASTASPGLGVGGKIDSFARITQQGGVFPSLQDSMAVRQPVEGAAGMGGGRVGPWGKPVPPPPAPAPPRGAEAQVWRRAAHVPSTSGTNASTATKNAFKGKTSLLSTASSRSYR